MRIVSREGSFSRCVIYHSALKNLIAEKDWTSIMGNKHLYILPPSNSQVVWDQVEALKRISSTFS